MNTEEMKCTPRRYVHSNVSRISDNLRKQWVSTSYAFLKKWSSLFVQEFARKMVKSILDLTHIRRDF